MRLPAEILILAVAGFAVAATAQTKHPAPAKKAAPAQPSAAKPVAKAAPAKPAPAKPQLKAQGPKAAAKPPATSRYSRSWTPAKPPARTYTPVAPLQPSPERVTEIQQALAAKGYYGGSPNGVWGADSIDALKRFQKDHNLRDDGKLSSLSLISLGLGPTRPASDPKPNPEK